jgi:hypothetical protein
VGGRLFPSHTNICLTFKGWVFQALILEVLDYSSDDPNEDRTGLLISVPVPRTAGYRELNSRQSGRFLLQPFLENNPIARDPSLDNYSKRN